MLVILLVGSIPSVSAFEFDNVKDFDKDAGISGRGVATIKNAFGMGATIAEIELLENTDNCIMNCYAEGSIILYDEGKLFGDLRFLKKDYKGKWKQNKLKDYGVLFKSEEAQEWEEYDGKKVGAGTYYWRIEGEKGQYETVDWLGSWFGVEIDEWAVWGAGLSDGLTHYWQFNETSGSLAVDVAGATQYNWSVSGSPAFREGIIGNGLTFLGTEQGTVAGAVGIPNGADYFTLNFWMNETADVSYAPLFGTTSGSNAGIEVYSLSGGIVVYRGSQYITGIITVTNDVWTMITVKSNVTGEYIYINGVYDTSGTLADAVNSGTLYMGDFSALNYQGMIDEMGLWNRTLSDLEVLDLYNSGSGITYDASLLTVTLNSPEDNGGVVDGLLNASYSTGGEYILENATYYVWDSDDAEFNKTTINLGGTTNSTTQNISNFVLGDYEWNVLVCSNDSSNTLCSWADSNYSLSFGSKVNNITWNATSSETASETFIINLSAISMPTTAKLWYKNVEYGSATVTTSGSNYLVSKTIDVPLGAAANEFYFSWDVGGTTILSSNNTQTISTTLFALCNSTLNTPFINYTFKDEINSSNINGIVTSYSSTYSLGEGTVNKSYSFTNSTGSLSYALCASPNKTMSLDYNILADAAGYENRRTQTVESISNTTTNRILYLLPTGQGNSVTFQIVNPAEEVISGVYLNISQVIGGADVTIASGYSGGDGGANFYLNGDILHKIILSKQGYTTKTISVYPTESTYTILLGTTSNTTIYDYEQGLIATIRPTTNSLFNDTTYNFNITLTSSYWDVSELGFVLRNSTTSLGSASTGGAGVIGLDLDVKKSDVIIMDYYWVINNTYRNKTTTWIVLSDAGDDWSLSVFFSDLSTYATAGMFGIDNFGLALITFITIFVVTGVVSYKYGLTSPAAIGTLLFTLVLFFDVGLGFFQNVGGIGVNYLPTIIIGIIMIGLIFRESVR